MPAGGIMFEELLKRLCPCYFNRTSTKESSTPLDVLTKKASSNRNRSFSGPLFTSLETSFNSRNTAGITTTLTKELQDSWKGTLSLVQPQPLYAFPMDLRNSGKRNQKTLLKPPLYWKKATKNLHPEGPPVFQEFRSSSRFVKKLKKKKQWKGRRLKHSETMTDLSTVLSPSTVGSPWLKSQSLDSMFVPYSKKRASEALDRRIVKRGGEKKAKATQGWTSFRTQILPDVCHGVILFNAAYHSRKKTCMIKIDRLERLSKKGRDENTYYSVVKLAVLPSEKYIKCTKILPNRSDPEVNEDFSFPVKESNDRVLRFSVFDASLRKQHEAIGHALLALEDIQEQPRKYRIKLYRWSQPHVYPGSLGLSLRYIENEDLFTISADKAKNLNLQKEKNVKLNTYVKVTFYSYGEKVKAKKSMTVMDSRNPNYNSTFTFQVRRDQIDYSSVAVTVRLKGFVNDVTIGRLNFGPFFFTDTHRLTPWGRVFLKKEFVSHWFRMYL